MPEIVLAPETSRPWREELSERVENFRRRRERLRSGFDPSTAPRFDFEDARDDESGVGAKVIEFPKAEGEIDISLQHSTEPVSEMLILETVPLDKTEGRTPAPASATVEPGELPLEPRIVERAPVEPVEIVLESPRSAAQPPASGTLPLVVPMAPLGRRFLAGVADTVVLLSAAGLFALIFWRAGGHISHQPLNILILTFMAVAVFLVYFGVFTALTSSTPGLLWMGLEVRNLDGAFPSAKDSFWRAFGYLVSTAALMLGFVWALVDSDGMTWHDRMSGTFLTLASQERTIGRPVSKADG